MKLRDLLKKGEQELSGAGVDNAPYEARELLKFVYGLDTAELLMNLEREITQCPGGSAAPAQFEALVRRRAAHEPFQYLTGTAGFFGYEFQVAPGVLIPRADTETLAEAVLEGEKDRDVSLLDVCTGTGCLGISLLKRGGYANVTVSDVSEEALSLTERNAKRLLTAEEKERFHMVRSDLFEELPAREPYDVIVSNPPYIPAGDIAGLSPEVRDHEPRLALDGGEDGLLFYRRLVSECRKALKDGGRMYLEIGYDQAEAVGKLMKNSGFTGVRVYRDLAGKDRAVKGVFHGSHG